MPPTPSHCAPMTLLIDTLASLTVDDLKALGHNLPDPPKTGPKQKLLDFFTHHLSGAPLQTTWRMLDDTQRLAIAEAVHEPLGRFSESRFHAKYGRPPGFFTPPPAGSRLRSWDRWPGKHTALCLFLHKDRDGGYQVPSDLRKELLAFGPGTRPGARAGLRRTAAAAPRAHADGAHLRIRQSSAASPACWASACPRAEPGNAPV